MRPEMAYVGADVSKARLDIAVRPRGDEWSEANNDARGIGLRFVARLRWPQKTFWVGRREQSPHRAIHGASASAGASGVEPVRLGRHDEVVPVQPFDLVSPPLHSDPSPLGGQLWVMALCLGRLSDLTREIEGPGEVAETVRPREPFDALYLLQLPVRHLLVQRGHLLVGHQRGVPPAGHALFG